MALTALIAGSPRASGQNALGSGNSLDANLAGSGSTINRRAPVGNFRDRNLVVTRDVAAGRGFRGTVGYTAEYDFRGELGSNDLYAERANMALSNPGLLSAGRTFERLRFGQYLGAVAYRRSGYGSSLQTVNQQSFMPAAVNDDRLRLDQITLSSTSHMIYESAADAQVVGFLQDEEGRHVVASASSLTGVQLAVAETQGQLIGLTGYDLARTIQDLEAGRGVSRLGGTFRASFEDLRMTAHLDESDTYASRIELELAEAPMEIKLAPQYVSILEGIAQKAASTIQWDAGAESVFLTELDRELERLRAELTGAALQETEVGTDQQETDPVFKIPDIAGPLRHGRRVEKLSDRELSRFNELVASAEEKLRDGEYFWAERRFDRALRFTPDHPLATAGLINAQIGAGLYVPAALGLRRLFSRQPEMIDVVYGPDLLPGRVRLNIAVRRLRELIENEPRDRGLHGLLLAYLGHQMADPSLEAEGLAVMEQNLPENRLLPLLKSIWLEEE